MTEPSVGPVNPEREELAAAFDGEVDPLASHAPTFDRLDVDPFALFVSEVLDRQHPAEATRRGYDRVFRQWRGHMAREGRHPACPNERHVRSFVDHLIDVRGNQPDTARTKLHRLNKTYRYWQDDPAFPHPVAFNPFALTLSKLDLRRPPRKQPPQITIDELRRLVGSITDIRDRAIIVAQLKLGLRASEVSNLRIEDVHLDDRELERGYPQLGANERLAGRSNVVYIAARHERDRNKSRRPRLLPLDRELQGILTRYLLTRPDTGAESVFLVPGTHNPIGQENVSRLWSDHFQPEYAETDEHRAVTSHYGRHRFTTFWRVEQDVNRELVKYMRGDIVEGDHPSREGIDSYIHTYFEDIETTYREHIFDLDLDRTP